MKRTLDVVCAACGLIMLFPLMLIVAIMIKASSGGPVFFLQERVGRHLKPFIIFKFRTMVKDASTYGRSVTVAADSRITAVGVILRKCKLDELPQLINVLVGDMSLVGPRPEVPKYVEGHVEDFKEILLIRPGITDLASIYFRNESEMLAQADDPEKFYLEKILPEKIRLAKEYQQKSSVFFDISIILKTLYAVFFPKTNKLITGLERTKES